MELKKIERFAIVILFLWLITLFVSPIFIDTLLVRYFDFDTYTTFSASQRILNIVLLFLTNLVELAIGIWLFIQAKSTNSAKWIWLMLGFVFRINAAILYYLIQYIDVLTQKKKLAT